MLFYPPEGVDVLEAQVELHHVEFPCGVIEPPWRYNKHLQSQLLVEIYLLNPCREMLLTENNKPDCT